MSLILFNKPFNVLSQFSKKDTNLTLKDFINEPGFYPAGRLDKNSEGLLILTNDGKLQHKITHPVQKMSKTYWVQIEGIANIKTIQKLEQGIRLKDGVTLPAKCQPISEPYLLSLRNPPIRFRKTVPDSWLQLTLNEGKNRQVRRMCSAVGHPVLRLIRYRIGSWTLDGIKVGMYQKINY